VRLIGYAFAALAVYLLAQSTVGLALNTAFGWWRADPAAGYVLVFYAAREVREIFLDEPPARGNVRRDRGGSPG